MYDEAALTRFIVRYHQRDGTLDQTGPLLTTTDLAVSFGGVKALEGVTTRIFSGEVVAVIGPNGAGKTTYLNAISGVLGRGARGEIMFGGERLDRLSTAARARHGIGRAFQHPPLLEGETVLDNLLVGSHLHLGYSVVDQLVRPRRVARRERATRERAAELLMAFGLDDVSHRKASELPYGSRKLVDIARALVSLPRLLLLDEPTSGLDAGEQSAVRDIINAVSSQTGITMLIIEHHMDVVRACASHVVGMQAGTVIASGSPDEVLDSEEFRRAALGKAAHATNNLVGMES